MVLGADEKSQIQALGRRQPGLPLKYGRCGTPWPWRTTALFAARSFRDFCAAWTKSFPAKCHYRWRWTTALTTIPVCGPRSNDILTSFPHIVQTRSSGLNLVERWFGELTSKRVRRSSFCSVKDLQNAIAEFMAVWSHNTEFAKL